MTSTRASSTSRRTSSQPHRLRLLSGAFVLALLLFCTVNVSQGASSALTAQLTGSQSASMETTQGSGGGFFSFLQAAVQSVGSVVAQVTQSVAHSVQAFTQSVSKMLHGNSSLSTGLQQQQVDQLVEGVPQQQTQPLPPVPAPQTDVPPAALPDAFPSAPSAASPASFPAAQPPVNPSGAVPVAPPLPSAASPQPGGSQPVFHPSPVSQGTTAPTLDQKMQQNAANAVLQSQQQLLNILKEQSQGKPLAPKGTLSPTSVPTPPGVVAAPSLPAPGTPAAPAVPSTSTTTTTITTTTTTTTGAVPGHANSAASPPANPANPANPNSNPPMPADDRCVNLCKGPAPLAPNYKCSDGTMAGPRCMPVNDGKPHTLTDGCQWQVVACPQSQTVTATCGDGKVDLGEQCDNGSDNGNAAVKNAQGQWCSSSCTLQGDATTGNTTPPVPPQIPVTSTVQTLSAVSSAEFPALSPDGSLMVFPSADNGSLTVFHAATQTQTTMAPPAGALTGSLSSLQFNRVFPTAQHALVANDDRTVIVELSGWDTSAATRATFGGPMQKSMVLAYDLQSQSYAVIVPPSLQTQYVALSPDGRTLAYMDMGGSWKAHVAALNGITASEVATVQLPAGGGGWLDGVSDDGGKIAYQVTSHYTGSTQAHVYDRSTGNDTPVATPADSPLRSGYTGDAGKALYTMDVAAPGSTKNSVVAVYDLASGQATQVLDKTPFAPFDTVAAGYSRDGRFVFFTSPQTNNGTELYRIDLQQGTITGVFQGDGSAAVKSFSANGSVFAGVTYNQGVYHPFIGNVK